MNIYEQGTQYSAFGHIDPLQFRQKCFADYYVKPVSIKHIWKKQVYNRNRKCYNLVRCSENDHGAFEITIGE